MSLTDLMSNLGLSFYPIVALVIFVAVFVTLMVRLGRTPSRDLSNWSRMPIDEDTTPHATQADHARTAAPAAMEGARAHG